MPKEFNADDRASEGALDVTIGGKKFSAKEPTLAVMKEIAESVPKDKPVEKDGEGNEVPRDEAEVMTEQVDSIYPQLAIVLRDDKGKPPTRKFIEENLSMRQAGELIATLMGEEDKEKNPR